MRETYTQNIQNDVHKGFLKKCVFGEVSTKQNYYMPHHAVEKSSSTSTKVRIVYDASARTKVGPSLNETLLVGPTVQRSIFDILLSWREHKVVFIADIHKMYKQIRMHPDSRHRP